MVTLNRQSLTYTLCTFLLSLHAEVSTTKFQLTFSVLISNQPITWLHNCVTTFAIIAVMSSCRDITCESIPGSPPPFLFFVGVRGEPGTRLCHCYELVESENFSVAVVMINPEKAK